MGCTVSSLGPLDGTVTVPGDLRLTLMLMSFGTCFGSPLTITAPSGAQEVAWLGGFLKSGGAEVAFSDDVITVSGECLQGDVTIGTDISDRVLHIVTGLAVFSAQSVRIVDGATGRARLVEPLLELLALLGVKQDSVSQDGDDVLISRAECAPSDVVQIRSQWAFEVSLAASLSSRCPVTISFSPGIMPLSERVLGKLGFVLNDPDTTGDYNTELERRIAKASGDRPPDVKRLEWSGTPVETFPVPGDTTVAAAVAACAAIIQRSEVTVKGVLWEPGRRGFFDALRRMKVRISHDVKRSGHMCDTADVHIGWSALEGVHLTTDRAETMTSELLILAATASSARGETVVSDTINPPVIGREAFKILARGLENCGVHIGDFTEGIVLRGGGELRGNAVDAEGLPATACALALAGVTVSGETTISNCDEDVYPLVDFLKIVRNISRSI